MFSRFFGGRKKQDAELHATAQSADLAGVRQALDKGADVNALSPVQNETALHLAVEMGNKALVQFLLSKGANPNIISGQNRTPLVIAASMGDRALPIVELLLAGRADPLLVSKAGPNAGTDALSIAASKGANAILRHLLAFGTVPRAQSNGATLMHMAGMGGDAETVALALTVGATVDDVDCDGATPLHYAATHANSVAVAALLDHQADSAKRTKQDKTPLDCAAAGNNPATLKLLLKQEVHPALSAAERDLGPSELPVTVGQVDAIRDMTLIEFGRVYYRNVRFQNVMAACAAQGQPPFETVGAYIDAGEVGKLALRQLPNIGTTSVNGLDAAILAAIQQPIPTTPVENPVTTKRQDLVEQLDARYPGVFVPLLNKYANTPLNDRAACLELEADMLHLLNDERFVDVILRRFRGETLADIGEAIGVSRERVRQISNRAKPWIATSAAEAPLPVEENEDPIPDGIRRVWFQMYLRLKDYQAHHGSADIPHQWPEDPKLAAWVSHQRQKYKKNELIPEQVKLLEELGFSWSLRDRGTWEDRLCELVEFKSQHGHFDVPTTYLAAPKLKQFLASTRYQYKTGTLDKYRIARLESIGFSLDTGTPPTAKPEVNFTPHLLPPEDAQQRGIALIDEEQSISIAR